MKDTDNWMLPIPKRSLSKTVMESIKKGIVTGAIKPGEYLPSESELANKFSVGKSSIREALKMLEAMGYIEICKGNGSRVRTSVDSSIINPLVFQLILQNNDSKDELLIFRKTIEIAAALLAIDTASSYDLQKIEDNIAKTKKDHSSGNPTFRDDIEFHELMYACTHNSYMLLIGKTIMDLFNNSIEISNTKYGEKVIQDHEAIYLALKNKDKESIKRAILDSLDSWYRLSLEKENT